MKLSSFLITCLSISGRTRSSIYINATSVFERTPMVICRLFSRVSLIRRRISTVFTLKDSVKLSLEPLTDTSVSASDTPRPGRFLLETIMAFAIPSMRIAVLPLRTSSISISIRLVSFTSAVARYLLKITCPAF